MEGVGLCGCFGWEGKRKEGKRKEKKGRRYWRTFSLFCFLWQGGVDFVFRYQFLSNGVDDFVEDLDGLGLFWRQFSKRASWMVGRTCWRSSWRAVGEGGRGSASLTLRRTVLPLVSLWRNSSRGKHCLWGFAGHRCGGVKESGLRILCRAKAWNGAF